MARITLPPPFLHATGTSDFHGDHDSLIVQTCVITSEPVYYWALCENLNNECFTKEPVQYEGDRVVFDPGVMQRGLLYLFTFGGESLFAGRRDDGTVDVFALEAE